MFKELFSRPFDSEQIILFAVVGLVLLVAVLVLVISTVRVRRKRRLEEDGNKVEDANQAKEVKAEAVKVEPKEEARPVKAEAKKPAPKKAQTAKADDAVNYDVIQNDNTKSPHFKKWRVKKSNSNKTIKHFETQQLAIEYATELANNAGVKVVVHKVDGTVRN